MVGNISEDALKQNSFISQIVESLVEKLFVNLFNGDVQNSKINIKLLFKSTQKSTTSKPLLISSKIVNKICDFFVQDSLKRKDMMQLFEVLHGSLIALPVKLLKQIAEHLFKILSNEKSHIIADVIFSTFTALYSELNSSLKASKTINTKAYALLFDNLLKITYHRAKMGQNSNAIENLLDAGLEFIVLADDQRFIQILTNLASEYLKFVSPQNFDDQKSFQKGLASKLSQYSVKHPNSLTLNQFKEMWDICVQILGKYQEKNNVVEVCFKIQSFLLKFKELWTEKEIFISAFEK